MNATRGLARTGTIEIPPMASAAKSVERTMLPALMSGSPSRSVEPRGARPNGFDRHIVVERHGAVLPDGRLPIITTASNASGKSSPVSART